MRINQSKTKTIVVPKNYMKHSIEIHIERLHQICKFQYVWPVISWDIKFDEELKERKVQQKDIF